MILRFEFKTKDCKFRKYNHKDDVNINDKRTRAYKQYRNFCKEIKSAHKYRSCWSEKATETSCVLALEV